MSLRNGDLEGTVLPQVSVDEFEPKAGNIEEVIVVAFYLKDVDPSEDLNTFIQRGFIDTLDVEVSPSMDENGNYLVFVEMSRDDTFPNKFQSLLKDVENVAGKLSWTVKTYLSDSKFFKFNDPELYNYIILNPEQYVTKDKFKMDDIKESIMKFFKDSYLTNLTFQENAVILTRHKQKLIAEVVDTGEYDTVIGRNFLSESAFRMKNNPMELRVLENMTGNCQAFQIEDFFCILKEESVVLLKNLQIFHGDR